MTNVQKDERPFFSINRVSIRRVEIAGLSYVGPGRQVINGLTFVLWASNILPHYQTRVNNGKVPSLVVINTFPQPPHRAPSWGFVGMTLPGGYACHVTPYPLITCVELSHSSQG